jgi:hypothetical protein
VRWPSGDESGQCVGSDAFHASEQIIENGIVLLDQARQLAIGLVQMVLEEADGRFDIRSSTTVTSAQTLPFSDEHAAQLSPAQQQCLQSFERLVGHGLDESMQILAWEQALSESGQHPSIDGIRLGQNAHGLGEVTGLSRIDHRDRQACGLQRTGDRSLIATRSLQHDQADCAALKAREHSIVAFDIVSKRDRRSVRAKAHLTACFSDIDANRQAIGGVLHGPSLQMRTSKSQQPFGLEKNRNRDPAPQLSHGLGGPR